MDKSDKYEIAAIARNLIFKLNECDDKDWVEEVISCVRDGEIYPSISPEFIT